DSEVVLDHALCAQVLPTTALGQRVSGPAALTLGRERVSLSGDDDVTRLPELARELVRPAPSAYGRSEVTRARAKPRNNRGDSNAAGSSVPLVCWWIDPSTTRRPRQGFADAIFYGPVDDLCTLASYKQAVRRTNHEGRD